MASLLDGFSYDIFISYRQKDNKYDGWVSEFVDNLRKELDTFKEEISVYFDINPHNGLLETHDVDASLKDKLKCLIFIPIISRTYCDPKSFAWEHEFKVFIEEASKDKFGLKVKVPGGNVANRVLPIQIHDLDPDDKKLIENELGGFLRGIEFIFKATGVNRPLMVKEANPQENLYHINYRDQINKVANAINEIISGLKNPDHPPKETTERITNERPPGRIRRNIKIISGSLLILALTLAGYFIGLKYFESDDRVEKSIAVLPFINLMGENESDWMSIALANTIIEHLYKIASFDRVVPLQTVSTFRESDKKITDIAGELKVNYILEGTYQKYGDNVKISVNLIDPGSDSYIWRHDYDQPYKKIISIQSDIALRVANQLDAFITSSEKKNITKVSTTNIEAYELLQSFSILNPSGGHTFDQMKEASMKAIYLDPDYSDAYAAAGAAILYRGVYIGLEEMRTAIWEALPYIEKALEIDKDNNLAHLLMGNINEWGRRDFVNAEKEYLRFRELAPNMRQLEITNMIPEFFLKMNQLDNISLETGKLYERGTSLSSILIKSMILRGNRQDAYNYINSNYNLLRSKRVLIGECYAWLQEYDSARICIENEMKSNNPMAFYPRFQAVLALAYSRTNQHEKAKIIIDQIARKSKETSAGSPEYFIGWFYCGIAEADSAFMWLEKAYKSNSPEFPWLKVDPVFENIKSDKRYFDLYERTGFKAYDDYKTAILRSLGPS